MPIRHVAALLAFAMFVPGNALAQSGPLTVVTVEAKDLFCIYDKSCKVSAPENAIKFDMQDTIGHLPQPRLHVRTVLGAAGSPAAGKTGYLYRLDMTGVVGGSDKSCATALRLDFGPTLKFEYFKNGANADLFVIDKGGPGTIGVSKAERFGNSILVSFRPQVCVGTGPNSGESSFIFGLTSEHAPRASTAQVVLLAGIMSKRTSTTSANAQTRTPAH